MSLELVFATHNQHKATEIQALVGSQFTIKTLTDIGCIDDIPETGNSFYENAQLKSAYVWRKYRLACFADDSGLVVPALNGAPGIHSARYAGSERSDKANTELLLNNLQNVQNRAASFVTVISLQLPEQHLFFEGKLNGQITLEPTGSNGFGYDPVFIPEGMSKTLAELSLPEKNKISHRAQAFEHLATFLSRLKTH